MSLEIMFEDHPIKKQAFLVSTNIDFTQWTYWDFFKGVNPWFWSKIGQIHLGLILDKWALKLCLMFIQLETNLSKRKNTSILHSGHTGIFKGANPWFWSKIGKISSQFDFGQMSLEIVFEDHPIRKQAFLTSLYKYWFYTVDTLRFFKMVNSWFWRKIGNFLFACFWTKISLEDDHLVIK